MRAFIVITVFTGLFSLLGYLAELHPLFELTVHFKLQYLTVSCCALLFFLFKREKIWALVSLFCLSINMAVILPWYWPQRQALTTADIRILELNLLTRNDKYSQVISLVREVKPNIAVFLEVNRHWRAALETLQESYPYHISAKEIMIYSQLPLRHGEINQFSMGKQFIAASVKLNGKELQVVAAHLHNPIRTKGLKMRNQQLVALSEYVTRLTTPVVVVGDLNTTMWSPYYQRFARQAGLRNARYGFGVLPTWPGFMPLIPIDHFLASPAIQVVNLRRGADVGSDHLPLIAELAIPDSAFLKRR